MKKLLYIPAILLLAACSKPKDKKTELADLQKQAADINAKITKLQKELGTTDSVKSTDVAELVVKPSAFTNYVDLQGSIDAKDNVLATPQAQGVITNIYVKVGDRVNAGQTMVQLDNSVLKQQIAQAESQASLMKTLFDRQIALTRFPSAVYFCRDDPQVSGAPVGAIFDRAIFVGFPIFHIKSVRDDPSARFQIQEFRPQFHIDARQQEHGDDLSL